MPAGLPPCCRLPGASTGGPSEKRKQNKGKITQGVSDFLSDSSVEEPPFGLLGPDTEGVPLKLSLPGLVRTLFVPAPCELRPEGTGGQETRGRALLTSTPLPQGCFDFWFLPVCLPPCASQRSRSCSLCALGVVAAFSGRARKDSAHPS